MLKALDHRELKILKVQFICIFVTENYDSVIRLHKNIFFKIRLCGRSRIKGEKKIKFLTAKKLVHVFLSQDQNFIYFN